MSSVPQHLTTCAVVVLLVSLGPAVPRASAQTTCAAIEPSTAFRGDPLHITLNNPPQATSATLSFVPVGGPLRGKAPLTVDNVPIASGAIMIAVPSQLPLGDYAVGVTAPGAPSCTGLPFQLRPPAGVKLQMFAFTPPGTYDTTDDAVHVTVRGSGFITDRPDDNRVIDVGRSQELPIRWVASCTGVNGASAVLKSAEEIELCNVPLRGRSDLALAISQYGVQQTPAWPFRVYRGDTLAVGLAAGVIATILALSVLVLVKQYKRAQAKPSQFNVLKILFLDLETDTYSLSKFQFYLWTNAALFGYTYLVISKLIVQGTGWPELPGNLPGIVAIGAGTAVGSQVATNIRGPKGSGTEKPSLGDLVMSGGVAAADRVQMLLWTLLGVGIFIVSVVQHRPGETQNLDSIPQSLLYMMGLSAAGYLGGKLARKPGPVLDEIHIDPTDPDDKLAAAAVPPPGSVNLGTAITQAEHVVLPAPDAAAARISTTALAEALDSVRALKTIAQAAAAVPALAAKRSIAETGATAAAEAMAKTNSPDAALAAETAQRAAAAVHDLETAVRAASASFINLAPGAPRFRRSITLRGRNLSANALFSIDGIPLSFRMLTPDPSDPAARRLPEVLIAEANDPQSGMVLRLSIDPGELEPADRDAYSHWFGTSGSHVLKITNLDGQQDDLTFEVPPASAQSLAKAAAPGPPAP